MTAVVLKLPPPRLTDEAFLEICQSNEDRQFELTASGELVIMPPVGGESGEREADYIYEVRSWSKRMQQGHVFSSSTIFKLPDGSKRSPDVAWIAPHRWSALSASDRQKFPPIAPDFVLELRSPSDDLRPLQEKLEAYLDNGVKLGFLINPQDQQVEIYRLGQAVEVRSLPTSLSGENVMPGFELVVPRF